MGFFGLESITIDGISMVFTVLTSSVVALWNLYREIKGGGGFSIGRLKSLVFIRDAISNDNELEKYLDECIGLEGFRIASGTRLNHREKDAFMRISALGLWGPEQLRTMAKYLKFPAASQVPMIVIGQSDVLEAKFSLLSCVMVFMSGLFFAIALTWKYGFWGSLGGAMAIVVVTFIGGFFVGGYGRLRFAKEVKEYLDKNPDVLRFD